jgi:hypothetical protein
MADMPNPRQICVTTFQSSGEPNSITEYFRRADGIGFMVHFIQLHEVPDASRD